MIYATTTCDFSNPRETDKVGMVTTLEKIDGDNRNYAFASSTCVTVQSESDLYMNKMEIEFISGVIIFLIALYTLLNVYRYKST